MALFKCKMCGCALDVTEAMRICECEYCGTIQTLPELDSDKKINLYDRANHFRRNNDFDKAMSIYETILNDNPEDAESYWSIVLCRYGIEYVEDPSSHKRIPMINRSQYTSIFADEDYKSALRYADAKCGERIDYLKKLEIYNTANTELSDAKTIYADADSSEQFDKAINCLEFAEKGFREVGDFQDSAERIRECEGLRTEYEARKNELEQLKLAAARKKKIIAAVVSAAVIFAVAAVCIVIFVILEIR